MINAQGDFWGGAYQIIGLPNLIRRLLQPSLGRINPSIALINILLHIAHVVVLKPPFRPVAGRCSFVFCFESLAVDFRAWAEVLFGVCELVVRAGADEVGAADFGVGDCEVGVAGRGCCAHELVWMGNEEC